MTARNAAALELLCAYVEQGSCAITPALVPREQKPAFELLLEHGALTRARAGRGTAICPCCEAEPVVPAADGRARCPECGPVRLTIEHMPSHTTDLTWLLRRLAAGLDLDGQAQPVSMIEEHAWRLGDVGGHSKRRVLFARGLGQPAIQHRLVDALPGFVGTASAILVTTTPLTRLTPNLPVPIVPLPAAFRLRGGALVPDGPVWAGVLKAMPDLAASAINGPFSEDFRRIQLPDMDEALSLTKHQAALFRELWRLDGKRLRGEPLMLRVGSKQDKPVDLFSQHRYREANLVYHRLVKNEGDEYWLPRD